MLRGQERKNVSHKINNAFVHILATRNSNSRAMTQLPFATIGENSVRAFGLSPQERANRFALRAALQPVPNYLEIGPQVLANMSFAWDPSWLGHIARHPGLVLTSDGVPVLAHVTTNPELVVKAMRSQSALDLAQAKALGLDVRSVTDAGTIENKELRKREQPYLMPLTAETVGRVEKASYDGAYKGVTDILTLYLWRGLAFYLTRAAAALRMTPNMVTAIGAIMCLFATYLFFKGQYWEGIAAGFVFMVLDTVDGKLARCTGTSSAWGNVFDHGIDLVHPPFWWWAWGAGLVAYGTPLPNGWLWPLIWIIVGGYVIQRLIEGVFIKRYGMHIHVWQQFDSRFRLITARRNPNMVLLIVALLFGRPDIGLIAVAVWTVLSCLIHLVRLFQAGAVSAQNKPIVSWLG